MKKHDIVQATTKRKTSVASAILRKGTGHITINGIPISQWTPLFSRAKIEVALGYIDSKILTEYDISVKARGGGVSSMTDASIVSILRCLMDTIKDLQLEQNIKNYDRSVLVPDTRRGMAKTPLGKGARAKEQKSYR